MVHGPVVQRQELLVEGHPLALLPVEEEALELRVDLGATPAPLLARRTVLLGIPRRRLLRLESSSRLDRRCALDRVKDRGREALVRLARQLIEVVVLEKPLAFLQQRRVAVVHPHGVPGESAFSPRILCFVGEQSPGLASSGERGRIARRCGPGERRAEAPLQVT